MAFQFNSKSKKKSAFVSLELSISHHSMKGLYETLLDPFNQ